MLDRNILAVTNQLSLEMKALGRCHRASLWLSTRILDRGIAKRLAVFFEQANDRRHEVIQFCLKAMDGDVMDRAEISDDEPPLDPDLAALIECIIDDDKILQAEIASGDNAQQFHKDQLKNLLSVRDYLEMKDSI